MKVFTLIIMMGFMAYALPAVFALSEAEIKKAIIAESIANYSGNCPCP